MITRIFLRAKAVLMVLGALFSNDGQIDKTIDSQDRLVKYYSSSEESQDTIFYSKNQALQPVLADVLEVGMSKYFYLTDGNRIRGKIVDIEGRLCHIETAEGILKIPMTDILEEAIDLTKIDDTRYKGPLIKEDNEKLILRSKYGDVSILKKEIHKMERFHGGQLAPEVESRRTFDQGEDELIGVFMDNNAFVLEPNTFFLSAMSVGYGFTDRFMITTRYGSNFNGDLNLHPKLRLFHKKSSANEKAFSIGMGIHQDYPLRASFSAYSHAYAIDGGNNTSANDLLWKDSKCTYDTIDGKECYVVNDFIDKNDDNVLVEAYAVYSSKRKNPTGRGKVGWSVGFKTSNILSHLNDEYSDGNGRILKRKNKAGFELPYRLFALFDYDLQKKIKFVGAFYFDNSNRQISIDGALDDYFGNTGSPLSFDSLNGEYKQFSFDFGFMYTVNQNFRIGIHFQQPYIDFHWEFFEF